MPSILPGAIWPILGSIFMFRLIIYMYDLSHSKEPVNIARTLSYFFLLPNVVFPFFPLVDYNTFQRTYYDEDRYKIYQSGIRWLLIGAIHLILYRFVNYYLMIPSEEVDSFSSLVRFAVSNFLLYLKVSGQFHMIIGILHLFGFNLPRTNNHYFLASGFVDLWRRVNIYWKEFMLKVFYYPIYFRLRKLDGLTRLILATALVMFLTWLLHAYQWFWLRGTIFFVLPDIVFWSILGTLVVLDVLRETKRPKKRSLGVHSWKYLELISLSVSIALTFSFVSILWSMWSSNSISEWWSLWSVLGGSLTTMGLYLFLFAIVGLVIGSIIWFGLKLEIGTPKKSKEVPFFRSAFMSSGLIVCVFLLGSPGVYTRLPENVSNLMGDLSTARLSQRDALQLQKGYYEDLTGVDRFNSDLWEIYSKRPTEWPLIQETEAARMTGDFRILELLPSKKIDFHGGEFTTNRWGMRDMEYEQVPTPNTYRIAIVGPSFVMGSGISDRDVFEAILERHLNEQNDGKLYDRYEFLNFGVAGHASLQELWTFEEKVLSFKPNAVFFVSHQIEEEVTVRNLALSLSTGVEIPYDYLEEIARKAGVQEGMPQSEVERLLKPYSNEILSWTYHRFVDTSRENGITPVWVFMPTLEFPLSEELKGQLYEMAEEAGFITLDLSDVYENQEISSIIVAEWDLHPNSKGNQLIASRLYEALLEKDELIQMGLSGIESLP
jgi:D-alanyl-lipoteichoic acid acyltransferase DltB (MBOAT superfamily)